MKKILPLIFISIFSLQNLFANEHTYSAKFDKLLLEFLNQGGSVQSANILRTNFAEINFTNKGLRTDFNELKLKLLPVFLGLKFKDQKIIWQMYINKKPKINRQIKL